MSEKRPKAVEDALIELTNAWYASDYGQDDDYKCVAIELVREYITELEAGSEKIIAVDDPDPGTWRPLAHEAWLKRHRCPNCNPE